MTLTPTTSIDRELADLLRDDEPFRNDYIRSLARAETAAEIRSLRKKRKLLQGQVAELAGMKQSAVSRIEQAKHDAWTFKTLIRIAQALQARLRITFEPIEDVAAEYTDQGEGPPIARVSTADRHSIAALAQTSAHEIAMHDTGGGVVVMGV